MALRYSTGGGEYKVNECIDLTWFIWTSKIKKTETLTVFTDYILIMIFLEETVLGLLSIMGFSPLIQNIAYFVNYNVRFKKIANSF
jgi:hypothetical protein